MKKHENFRNLRRSTALKRSEANNKDLHPKQTMNHSIETHDQANANNEFAMKSQNHNSPDTGTAPRSDSPKRRWKTAVKLLVFLALIAPFVNSVVSRTPVAPGDSNENPTAISAPSRSALFPEASTVPAPPVVDWAASKEEIRSQLKNCLATASLEESAVWQQFVNDWTALCEQNEESLDAGVDDAVNTLCQPEQIGWLVADFAQDKIWGGEQARSRIEQCSRKFLDATERSSVLVRERLVRLQTDLEAVNNRYAADVGDVLDDAEFQLPAPDYRELAATYQTLTTKISFEVIGSGVAVGFEAIMIKGTVESLVKLLAKVLGPQIAKAAAGLGFAVADGPLPIGDIVTIGLAAWTVWDVATLPSEIRGDVRESFESARNAQLRQLGGQALSAVKQLRAASSPARRHLFDELVANL